MATFQARELYDALGSFEEGVNSGIDPLKIPRSQLASGSNVTVRGTFATNRAAYRKINLSQGLPAALFQGACFFKPETGAQLVSSIAGRLFSLKISGNSATVKEVSTSGLQQDSGALQCWLWQAERWVIWNDGISSPIFYDGVNIRRSLGTVSGNVGTVGSQFIAPAQGNSVTFTSSGPYLGTIGQIITLNGKRYRVANVVAVGAGAFSLTLKNLREVGGGTVFSGVNLQKASDYFGFTANNVSLFGTNNQNLGVSAPYTGAVGSLIAVTGEKFSVQAISPDGRTLTVRKEQPTGFGTIGPGAPVQPYGITITWTTMAVTAAQFTTAAPGQSVIEPIVSTYTGAVGDILRWEGTHHEVTAIGVDSSAGYTITLINIDDVPGNVITIGTPLLSSFIELPPGRMGAYGLGRNWICLTDGISFIASDIVGGSSGAATYAFSDSVLKITENLYLSGGGVFRVPTAGEEIRAMIFVATLDASLGQGPLQVFTPNTVFSCNAPVDRTTWQDLTNPILTESLISNGGQGQNSTVIASGDTFFRSTDGLRSLILGRRDFGTWGNVPSSREVQSLLDLDNFALLPFASALVFDNRLLITRSPVQSGFGVYHPGLIALNFDPVSSLRGKAPSVYDGPWDGLNVLQLVKGIFDGVERAFAFSLNADLSAIELLEILPSEGPRRALKDNDATVIEWSLESSGLNFGQVDPRKRDLLRLLDGEIFVDRISSEVTFQAYYKPDQWPNWVPWFAWTETYDPTKEPGFRPRMGLGEPAPDLVDETNNRPLREAFTYQFKLAVNGSCRFLGARFKAVTIPQPEFAPPKAS